MVSFRSFRFVVSGFSTCRKLVPVLCLVLTLMARKFSHSTPRGRYLRASSHTLNEQFASKLRTKEGNSISALPTALTIGKRIWTLQKVNFTQDTMFDTHEPDCGTHDATGTRDMVYYINAIL